MASNPTNWLDVASYDGRSLRRAARRAKPRWPDTVIQTRHDEAAAPAAEPPAMTRPTLVFVSILAAAGMGLLVHVLRS
jgi:hypothetical protein